MGESVQNWCYKCRLIGMHEVKIMDFAKAQGDEATIEILQKVYKTREHQKGNGMPEEPAQRLWGKLSELYVQGVGGRRRAREMAATTKANEAAYRASLARGFVPTKEVLRKQIEDLYEKGEINADAYYYGIGGVEIAIDLVAVAGELTEDEQAVVDGYDDTLGV